MKNRKSTALCIAGLHFELHGDLPLLDEFVCCSEEKNDGQIFCVYNPLFDGSEKLVSNNNGTAVFIRKDNSWLFLSFEMPNCVQTVLSSDYKTVSVYSEDYEDEKHLSILRNLLRMALECILIQNFRVSLHSSCVEINGEAVAFTGVSGVGKSTRASVWISANGAEFISGDRPALRFSANGVSACGVPWDGKEKIFRNVERPLKAILDVRRSNSDYLRKLTPEQAQSVLMKQIFIPMWDTNLAVTAIMRVKKLVKEVPVYRLFCGPDEKNAKKIYNVLFENQNEISEAKKDMKIKEGFVLRKVADEYIVMPTGSNISKFDGAVALNEVSAFVFEQLKKPVSKEDLVVALLDEYEVDKDIAERDIDILISKFENMGIIE